MPRYYVTVQEVHCQGYYVTADSEEEAAEIAAIEGDIDEGSFSYSHTLPKATVRLVEEGEENVDKL